jgi:hypothetical protein
MRRFVIILLLLFFLPTWGFSSNSDSTINVIFKNIYNQEFDKAESQLIEESQHLNDFYSTVLNIDLLWWKYSSTRSKTDARTLNNYLNKIEPKYLQNPKDKIKLLICKSYQLRYARKRYNLFDIIGIRSEIKDLLLELDRNKLSISGNQLKLFDFYIVMFEYFDKVNPFFVQSTSDKRKNELLVLKRFSKEDDLVIRTMAQYFLGRIYQKVENKPEMGKLYFEILTQQFPKNSLFKEHLEDCENRL